MASDSKKKGDEIKGAGPFFIEKNSRVGVLLLHGFTSTPYQFRELGKFLADKGLTVYVPLIAGHGTCPEDLMKTNGEDWKNSAKEAYLELKKKVQKIFLLGNSFGGNLAFSLAKENDSSLAGIISLGTPINLRFQSLTKLRLFLYGRFKKYYRKPRRFYRLDYTDMSDEVTYSLIPVKSIKEFIKFLAEETIPSLPQIKTPALIIHGNIDPVVNPGSALYIYENLGSRQKMIYLFDSNHHVVLNDKKREELFQRIYNFIKETS